LQAGSVLLLGPWWQTSYSAWPERRYEENHKMHGLVTKQFKIFWKNWRQIQCWGKIKDNDNSIFAEWTIADSRTLLRNINQPAEDTQVSHYRDFWIVILSHEV